MSAIASFIKLPTTALIGLRQAAVPKKRLFRAPLDTYFDYLDLHGEEVADYEWSGYVLGTLLPYLQELDMDLMKSEYQELADFLNKSRQATHFFLTHAHRSAYLERIRPESFSEQQLCSYYNEFNDCNEPEIAKPMLAGIDALHKSLESLDDSSVVLLTIG